MDAGASLWISIPVATNQQPHPLANPPRRIYNRTKLSCIPAPLPGRRAV